LACRGAISSFPTAALSGERCREAALTAPGALRTMKLLWIRLLCASLALGLNVAHGKLRVTATTTIVADLVRQIGGDRVEIAALMGAGVDPHLYKASAGDVHRLSRADVIFYSGLFLEGRMDAVLRRVARR